MCLYVFVNGGLAMVSVLIRVCYWWISYDQCAYTCLLIGRLSMVSVLIRVS